MPPPLSCRDMALDLAQDVLVDLLRSAWVIESARASVFQSWSSQDRRFAVSARRARERAELVLASLEAAGGRPDPALVEPHAEWIGSVIGSRPGEVAFGDLFLARLGDWVHAHAGPLLEDPARMAELGREETGELAFPEKLPAPPPFERVAAPPVEPPGEVTFRFGILADLHMGAPGRDALVQAAVAGLNRSGAELVIQLGDLTDHGNPGEFEKAATLLGELEMPWVAMMGNHDVFSFQEGRLMGKESYAAAFGREPGALLMEHKGVRFAVLDSAEHAVSPFPSFDLVSGAFLDEPGGGIARGSLTVAQHEILAEVAAPGTGPAFVFLHHPPQPFTSFPPILFGLRDADSGRLHATVDSGNVWAVFAGHTHRNATTRTYSDGIRSQEVATAADYPFGYALVDVTISGYAFRFVQIDDGELLRTGYARTGEIQRRYSRGTQQDLAFAWARPRR
jgi:3',5'-cyclic-AMP phosphodiesterase